MQIQIQLKQPDIEAAIKDYLVKVGMTSPVDTINFTVTRKDGQTISASIDLSPEDGVTEQAPETKAEEKPAAKKTRSKPELVKEEKAEEPVAETPEPEAQEEAPAAEEAAEPPFTPDQEAEASNDGETVAEKKSLFS